MRKSSIITAVLVVIALVIALQYFLDDDGNPSITPTPTPTNGMKKGFGLSPYDYSSEGFNDFLAKTKLSGGVITWSGDWTQLSDTKSGPSVVARLAKSQGLESIIIAQFFTQFTRQPIRTLNESTLKSYKDSAVNFTRANKPRYIGFGIEVNVISSSPDYLKFKAFFSELKTAIKAVSAETKVFTVFQLEMMKGLNGGLFGGVNDPMNAQWYLINDFQMDCVAFTTYPCLVYKDPNEIPKDYYNEISRYTSLPIIFTEIGWFRLGPVGWESNTEEQVRFIKYLFEAMKDVKPDILVWSFMYDQDVIEPFNTMGLINKNVSNRLAWDEWLKG